MDSSLIPIAILIPITAVIAYLTFQPKQQISELLERFDEGSGIINSQSKDAFDISGTYQGHEVNFKFQPSKEIVTGTINIASNPSTSYTVTKGTSLETPEDRESSQTRGINLIISPEKGSEHLEAMHQHESVERMFASSYVESGFERLSIEEEKGCELSFRWPNSAVKSNYLTADQFLEILVALVVLSH